MPWPRSTRPFTGRSAGHDAIEEPNGAISASHGALGHGGMGHGAIGELRRDQCD